LAKIIETALRPIFPPNASPLCGAEKSQKFSLRPATFFLVYAQIETNPFISAGDDIREPPAPFPASLPGMSRTHNTVF